MFKESEDSITSTRLEAVCLLYRRVTIDVINELHHTYSLSVLDKESLITGIYCYISDHFHEIKDLKRSIHEQKKLADSFEEMENRIKIILTGYKYKQMSINIILATIVEAVRTYHGQILFENSL